MPQASGNRERTTSLVQSAVQCASPSPSALSALRGRRILLVFVPIPLAAGGRPGLILLAQLDAAMVLALLRVIPVHGWIGGVVVGASAEPVHEVAQQGEPPADDAWPPAPRGAGGGRIARAVGSASSEDGRFIENNARVPIVPR